MPLPPSAAQLLLLPIYIRLSYHVGYTRQQSSQELGERFDACFRVGDKVMQRQNDYTREVSNGDVGKVVRLHEAERAGPFVELVAMADTVEWSESWDLVAL